MVSILNKAHEALSLLYQTIFQQVDQKDELIQLADKIDWYGIGEKLKGFFSDKGREALPLRLMVGLLIIKYIYNLSDEKVVDAYKKSQYVQYFCGEQHIQKHKPCSESLLSQFRTRIGEEGCKYIFQESVRIHGENALEEDVVVDSTVQPKNITYPTPTKLLVKVLGYCYHYAKKLNIHLSDSYKDLIKPLIRTLRFEKSCKKAGTVKKKMTEEQKGLMRSELDKYHQIIKQTEPKTLYYIEKNAQKSIQDFAKIIGFCCKYSKNFNLNIMDKNRHKFIEHVHNIKNKAGKGKKKYINQEIDKIFKIASDSLESVESVINEFESNDFFNFV